MATRKYSVVSSKKGHGWVLEDGVRIARYNITLERSVFRFGSDASEQRFDVFCNCLSRKETVQALGGKI